MTRSRELAGPLRESVTQGERTFRIMLSDSNRTVSASDADLRQAESWIERMTRLQPRRRGADVEFWVLGRREGHVAFAKRISRRAKTEANLQRGELRPELSCLLCRLSEPTGQDVFLDPFAGTGSIVLQRLNAPFNMVFASDNDPELVAALRAKVKAIRPARSRIRKHTIVRADDALTLSRFEDGFIHKVVTDPPWGMASMTDAPIDTFYHSMFDSLCRVTRDAGVIILLSAQKDLVHAAVANRSDSVSIVRQYDILVAGAKAAVFKLERLPRTSPPRTGSAEASNGCM